MTEVDELTTSLCTQLARATLEELSSVLNDMPFSDHMKMSMLFTIEVAMMNMTLDGVHQDKSIDERLKLKLEFLRIIRINFIKAAQDERNMKEKKK